MQKAQLSNIHCNYKNRLMNIVGLKTQETEKKHEWWSKTILIIKLQTKYQVSFVHSVRACVCVLNTGCLFDMVCSAQQRCAIYRDSNENSLKIRWGAKEWMSNAAIRFTLYIRTSPPEMRCNKLKSWPRFLQQASRNLRSFYFWDFDKCGFVSHTKMARPKSGCRVQLIEWRSFLLIKLLPNWQSRLFIEEEKCCSQ